MLDIEKGSIQDQVSDILDLFYQLEESAPTDFMYEVGILVYRKPDEESLANNMIFGHKAPVT